MRLMSRRLARSLSSGLIGIMSTCLMIRLLVTKTKMETLAWAVASMVMKMVMLSLEMEMEMMERETLTDKAMEIA